MNVRVDRLSGNEAYYLELYRAQIEKIRTNF